MLSAFINTFKIAELRQRILFTFGLILVCRLISMMSLPGIDIIALREVVAQGKGSTGGGLAGMFDLFSGGAFLRCSIGTLGIMPYISASIIIQLMSGVIPHLEKLKRDGDVGHQRITQYTRYLTVILCAVQGVALVSAIQAGKLFSSNIVRIDNGFAFILLGTLALVAASMLFMWIGEQITDRGIGNGISIIITINIISRLPSAIKVLIQKMTPVDGVAEIGIFHVILLVALIFFVILGVVAMTQAQQKVPVQYAKRMVGKKTMGGTQSHLPLRVNYSGVMPIIFASAILAIPGTLLSKMPYDWARSSAGNFVPGENVYQIIFGLMILFFSYFWVATQFNPIQIADNLKRQGGYVPGIRPGRPTADYLDRTMTRLTLAGAVFLTAIATLPVFVSSQFNMPMLVASFFGGTSLLIIVGVMIDTMRQVESHLLMRHYDGFLKKGKIRGRNR